MRLRLIAITMLVAGLTGLGSEPFVTAALHRWVGDPTTDVLIDETLVSKVGELMSVDRMPPGLVVSYEYTDEGVMYVGYASVPPSWGPRLKPFDLIDIETAATDPSLSRVAGTRRVPRGHIVTTWLTTRSLRRGLSAGLTLLGLALGLSLVVRARAR